MPLETPENPAAEHPQQEPRNNKGRNPLVLLALLIVGVGLVGALAWDFALQTDKPGTEHNAVLGITIFIQAMIAFFGILNLEEPHRTKVHQGRDESCNRRGSCCHLYFSGHFSHDDGFYGRNPADKLADKGFIGWQFYGSS